MKIKLDGVAETLLITLNARAKDYENPKSVLHDKKSFEIASQLDYDFKKFDTAWASYYGILARAYIMDEEVKKFIEKYPNCVIVSIGCGLDTRFERVDNGKITWYNLDLPEVIETRKLFFKENDRVKNISKSVFESDWTKEVITDGKELLIISEGVFMYFSEDEIKKILRERKITNGIGTIERNLSIKMSYDLIEFAPMVYTASKGGIQCYTLEQVVNKASLENILSNVKIKLIDILLDLESTFGELDQLDIDVKCISSEELQTVNETLLDKIYYDGKRENNE